MGWWLPLLDSYTRQDEGQFSSSSPVCHSEGPGEIKRREVVLDPVVSPEEIMSREVELGCESWTFLLQVVTQQQCNRHCPCDSALAQQLKQQLRSTLVAAQWRGDTALKGP